MTQNAASLMHNIATNAVQIFARNAKRDVELAAIQTEPWSTEIQSFATASRAKSQSEFTPTKRGCFRLLNRDCDRD
jgi:hypothetical protein